MRAVPCDLEVSVVVIPVHPLQVRQAHFRNPPNFLSDFGACTDKFVWDSSVCEMPSLTVASLFPLLSPSCRIGFLQGSSTTLLQWCSGSVLPAIHACLALSVEVSLR